MSIIFATFPAERRGRVLATWNTVGPVTGSVGPLLAGFLLERFHWSAIFVVPLLVTGLSIVLLARLVPERHSGPVPWARIRRMDWLGLLLLIGFVTFFVSYLSSRPVTGVDPLLDLRLGVPAAAFLVAFVIRERRVSDPFVPLSLLRLRAFTGASLASAARMFLLAGVNFLMPLYVSDVYGLGSAVTGLVVTTNAFALMITMRIGGHLVDRALSPLPVVFGLLGQAAAMSALALLPSLASPWPIFVCVGAHGLAAGIALGPMHKFALSEAAEGEVGMAAGLYSLIRFIGVLIGAAIGGVVLQAGLDAGVPELVAYRYTFVVYMGVGLGGSLLARLLLRKG
jgi:MFS family permease